MSEETPIVLVHGGGHGAWCWEPTLPFLDGPLLAVDLPPQAVRGGPDRHAGHPDLRTLTLRDFAASALADIDAAGHGRVVLVGHSMGGLTISEIARVAPERVAHLVYVSCMVPPEGGTAIDCLPAELRDLTRTAVEASRSGGPDPVGGLDEATMRIMFCNDMDEAQTQFVLDRTGGEAAGILAEPVSRVGIPPDLPKTYVRLARDQSLAPDLQDTLIANLRESPGGDVEVIELDTGHDVMISAPELLAGVLNGVAAGASART
jgi:pimeloyl-ACP methyl ester carboxylesterase